LPTVVAVVEVDARRDSAAALTWFPHPAALVRWFTRLVAEGTSAGAI
jgi:hypothetical protein